MNNQRWSHGARILRALLVSLILAGCTAAQPAQQPGVADLAQQQATLIIAQAQATAILLKAQAQATALVAEAGKVQATVTAEGGSSLGTMVSREATPGTPVIPAVPTVKPTLTDLGDYHIELVDVGFAAEGKMIIVQFKATRKATDDIWPGRVSVTDEASGTVYQDVPTMPIIGVMIGRPANPGQVGYVMFNNSPGLPPGGLVTVKLGKFLQEHVRVKDQ